MIESRFSGNSRRVYVFKDIHEISGHVIKTWKELSEKAITETDLFTAVLSGGKTPIVIYEDLSHQKDLQWDRTHVFMTDERFVPYNSEDNNYQMINRTLLRHVPIPARNVHPILTTENSPQASAERYAADLASFFGLRGAALPQFELIVLGIGEDGHTASLFPEGPALKEKKRLAVAVPPGEDSGPGRITLSLPVINSARNILFVVSGKNKAGIIHEIIGEKNDSLPAALVNPEGGKLFFLLDEDAGSLLAE